jgi:hypothetical protein
MRSVRQSNMKECRIRGLKRKKNCPSNCKLDFLRATGSSTIPHELILTKLTEQLRVHQSTIKQESS